jgi:archaellum component FlaF (FlaF/FlaG flagellin family)
VPAASVANAPPTWAPVAKAQKKVKRKAQKKAHAKVTSSVVVVVTNSRSVALSELEATPSGGTLPNTIVSNLAPGKTISVTVTTVKACVFNLHGAYADGSNTDSTSVDLCKDQNVNLVE